MKKAFILLVVILGVISLSAQAREFLKLKESQITPQIYDQIERNNALVRGPSFSFASSPYNLPDNTDINDPLTGRFLEDVPWVKDFTRHVVNPGGGPLYFYFSNTEHFNISQPDPGNPLKLRFEPIPTHWFGSELMVVTVSDEPLDRTTRASATAIIRINVTSVPDPPVFSNLPLNNTFYVNEDEFLSLNFRNYVRCIDSAQDNFDLYVLQTQAPIGPETYNVMVTQAPGLYTGHLVTFTPQPDYNNPAGVRFLITAVDRVSNGFSMVEILLVVVPENDPPEILSYFPASLNIEINQNDTQHFEVNVLDLDNDPLVETWTLSGTLNGAPFSQVVSNTSTLDYQFVNPGIYTLTYVVSDAWVQDSVTWTVTVKPIGPIFSPVPDPAHPWFTNGIAVSLSVPAGFEGATIYYTTDGSIPAIGAPGTYIYEQPIEVPALANIENIKTIRAFFNLPSMPPASQVVSYVYRITGQVADPVFNPLGGNHFSQVLLNITSPNLAATIYYTTDGSDPVPGNPGTLVYSGPILIPSGTYMVVKAMARRADWIDSNIVIQTYNVTGVVTINSLVLNPPTPPEGEFYTVELGDYIPLTVQSMTLSPTSATLYYLIDTTPFDDASLPGPDNPNSIAYTPGAVIQLTCPTIIKFRAHYPGWLPSGTITYFYDVRTRTKIVNFPNGTVFNPAPTTSTEALQVYINTETVPANAPIYYTLDGSDPIEDPALLYTGGPINLSQNYRSYTIKAMSHAPDICPSQIYTGVYEITGAIDIPQFDPVPREYQSPQMITISTQTPGTTIYYSLDGTDPDTNANLYLGPIALGTGTHTLKAIAYKANWLPSPVRTGLYRIGYLPPPIFSLPGGNYTQAIVVQLFSPHPGANIFYSLTGGAPFSLYDPAAGIPVGLNQSISITAYANMVGWADSDWVTASYNVTGSVAMPTFNPGGGSYAGVQNVTISTATPGATIRYTLDGQDPSLEYGTTYTGPVTIAQSATLRARAYLADWAPSPINSADYTIFGNIAAPVFIPAPGIYTNPVSVVISVNPPTASIYYTTDGSDPSASSTLYTGVPVQIAANSTVTLRAIAIQAGWNDSAITTGVYQVTGRVATPVFNPPSGSYPAAPLVTISTSTPGAAIRYTTDGSDPSPINGTPYAAPVQLTGSTVVKAIAYLTDWDDSVIASASYVVNAPVAAPVFSPGGGYYSVAPQNVSISSSTPGAEIRYTLDGSEPDQLTGLLYDGTPIAVSQYTRIRARAYKADHIDSSISQAEYFFMTANPVLNPAAGAYPGAIAVSMTSATPGASIRYTVDGADPTPTSGTVYDGNPIDITQSSTLRAIAYRDGWMSSNVVIHTYVINGPVNAPQFSIAGGDYFNAFSVGITTLPSNAVIYYTTDGSDPSESNGFIYNPATPVPINVNTVLKARAYLFNWQPSPISTAVYNLFTRPVSFNPVAGIYSSAQMVTLSSITPAARIWFTTDASDPVIDVSAEYDGTPINVAVDMVIKAIARVDGWYPSAITSAAYDINIPLPQVATPLINPPSGVYTAAVDVTISTATPDAQIWYTLNGPDPTPLNGILFTDPGFSVDTNTVVRARAYKDGFVASDQASAQYVIVIPIQTVAAPTFSPAPGVYDNSVVVTISTTTPGADIYYTLNGAEPDDNSILYTGPITLTSTTNIKAVAYKNGMNTSLISNAGYVINIIVPNVEAPVFSLASGLYYAPIDVAITTGTADANIWYSFDGSDPTPGAGGTMLYTGAISIPENTSRFIKARAYKDGWNTSPVVSASYNVTGTVEDIQFSVLSGTYTTPQSLILTTSTADATIRYTTDGSDPTPASTPYITAIPINASMTVKARGYKTNWLPGNVGAEVYVITGSLAFDQPSLNPAPGTYSNAISVTISNPIPADAAVWYTTDGSVPSAGNGTLYSGPIAVDQALNLRAVALKDGWVPAFLSGNYNFAAAAPSFLPPSGAYPNAQLVSLSSSSVGAGIRFTTDGTDPTALNGSDYLAPINVEVNQTIKAYAFKAGYLDSPIVSATYAIGTFIPVVDTPVLNPASGTYTSAQFVAISVGTPGAVIRYTLDGSEPTEASLEYSAPIALALNTVTTVKAKAFKTDWMPSATATELYVITGQVAAPTFTPPAGDYTTPQNVVLLSATEGAFFRYTLDGSDPVATSPLYTTPINVPLSQVTTIKARAYKSGWADSEVSTAVYNVTGRVAFTPPAITPPSGVYGGAVSVVISAPVPATATVRYTLDGSVPSRTNGMIYVGPFDLETGATVQAIAYLDGWDDSQIVAAQYGFGVAAPVFDPQSGTYASLQVSISSATSGASIRYTLDGSDPSPTLGTLYAGPIVMPGNNTYQFKAIAYKDGWQSSVIVPATYIVTGTVADVVFSIPSGTYTAAQNLVLSTPTSGAAIYYTTDGSEPNQASSLYTTAIVIPLNSSLTIRARAYRDGWLASGISVGIYNVTGTTAFDQPHFSPAPGTYANAVSVSISQPIPATAQVWYTTDGSLPSETNGTLYTGPIPVDQAILIRAVAVRAGWIPSYISGNYDFMAAAPVFAPPAGSYGSSQNVVLSSSTVGAAIRYTTDGSDPSPVNGMDYSAPIAVSINQTIKAYSYKAGYQDSPIVSATYAIGTYIPIVVTPVFDPLPGNFTAPVAVSISTPTPGAEIRYTMDGTDPDAGSPVYSAPIIVPNHTVTTLKAKAFKEEWLSSPIAVGTYNVTGTVSDVIFTPAGGSYTTAQNVVLTSLTEGAYFRYTTDGTDPTDSSPLYVTAIPVGLNSSVTIKARAYKTGWAASAVGSESYNVTGQVSWPAVIFNPGSGSYGAPVSVSIATPTPSDASIRYTLDGSDPSDSNGLIYSGAPIVIGSNATLKAIAWKAGWNNSPIVTAAYQFGVAAPVFAPVSGTYQSAISVSMSSTTAGASIRFTTDGSDPTPVSGTLYTGPINLPQDSVTLFKAIAYLDGWNASTVAVANYVITGTVADVTFSVPGGTYTTAQSLTLSSATAGALIYYTTDGSTPTQSSSLYTGAIQIPLNTNMTVRARAFRTGWLPSAIGTEVYNVTGTTAFVMPSFNPAPGAFSNPITVSLGAPVPFDALVYYTTDGSVPSASNGFLYSGPIPMNTAMTLRAVAIKAGWVSGYISGDYSFTTAAPGFNPPGGSYPNTQSVVLSSATVGASIRYTVDGTDPSPVNGLSYTGPITVNINQTIKAYAFRVGYNDSPIVSATYAIGTYVPVVATPVFNPLPGSFTAPVSVSISTTTSGATIRYTTNGSDPTSTSPVYSAPIVVPNHTVMTIKAMAFKDEWTPSQIAVGTYTVTGTVQDVVFNPLGGNFTTAQNVVITTPTPGAAIFYTTDGSDPTQSSIQYTQAVQLGLNTTTTLKARAFVNGWNPSAIGSQTYVITGQVTIPGQVFTPVAGTYTTAQSVTISTTTLPAGATIRYTENGSDPTPTSPIYTGQTISVPLNTVKTVKARAFLTGWDPSPVYEAVYNVTGTIVLPTPTFTPAAGTYQTAQNISINAPATPTGVSLYYTLNGTDPTEASLLYQGPIALPLNSGPTTIKVRGYKAGWVPSTIASATYTITGTVAYMTPVFLPDPSVIYTSAVSVTINNVTPTDATVRYTLDGSEPSLTNGFTYPTTPINLALNTTTTIKTKAFKTDWTASQTFTATYTVTGQVSITAPVFTPAPGTYTVPPNVSISNITVPTGAVIRYTLDGSEPTSTSPIYTAPIPAPAYATTRIKVKAFATNWQASPTYEGVYVINGAAIINGPVFTPPAGTYTTAQSLVISNNTLPANASIYYTLDGSNPSDTNGTLYTTPIPLALNQQITVRVRAYGGANWDPSEVHSATYNMTGQVNIPAAVFNPNPGITYQTATMVTINVPVPSNATVRYTTDGSDPTQASSVYSGPIQVPLNTVMNVKARAYLTNWDPSPVYQATYTVTGQVQLTAQPFSPAPGTYTSAQTVTLAAPTLPLTGAVIRYTITPDLADPSTAPDPDSTSTQYTGPITVPLNSNWVIKIRGFARDWIDSQVLTARYNVTGIVEAPVFIIDGQPSIGGPGHIMHYEEIMLELSTATPGAQIYYTTAVGSDPAVPDQSSTLYDPAQPIMIPELTLDLRISARAFKQDWIPSATPSYQFTVIPRPYDVRAFTYGGYIRLLWNSDLAAKALNGFDIYRRRISEAGWTKLNGTPVMTMVGPDYYYDDWQVSTGVSYVYRVVAIYNGVESLPSLTTTIEYQSSELDISVATHAYPNPASTSTRIKLALTRNDNVQVAVSIYDFSGKKVRTLTVPPTNSNLIEIPWDLKNSSNQKVGRGTYFARIVASDGIKKAERTIKISVK